jgi:hypothetical protein
MRSNAYYTIIILFFCECIYLVLVFFFVNSEGVLLPAGRQEAKART